MKFVRRPLRFAFEQVERVLAFAFPPAWNPLYHLGALGFFFYWIVAVSGIYVYIFFDTGVTAAYDSLEYMTNEQWYLAGVTRSLHRYASDAMILAMTVHIFREFALGRYAGARWFTWVTGVPIAWLVFISGISGYWLVWDQLAQYVAVTTTEFLDRLPIFGEPIARNFLSAATLDDRFFTLVLFIHIAGPLILLLILWIHLQRVSRPEINPARGLAVGMFAMLLALSLVLPAESQALANLGTVPAVIGFDWFYLGLYPAFEHWPGLAGWGLVAALTLMILALPFLPPMRRAKPAVVDLPNCNGCTRCAKDCPYNAIAMMPRSDGLPFEREAVVSPSLCVSCGICVGACPTSMPFRRASALVPGIDLPNLSMAELRERVHQAGERLQGRVRVMVFGCDHGPRLGRLKSATVTGLSLRCIGQLPPAFIDYVLSRDLADGVVLTGCTKGVCVERFGIGWTEARLAGERDPHLRKRVPRERLTTLWVGRGGEGELETTVAAFAEQLGTLKTPASGRAARAPASPALAMETGHD